MELQKNEYEISWEIEALASRLGWKRTARQLSDRRIVLTFEKLPEPEPGAGKVDEA